MPERFYFDVDYGQEIIRDEEGVEADDLDQALADARSVIWETADELGNDALSDALVMLIRDETGSIVARLLIEKPRSSPSFIGVRCERP